MHTHFDDHDWQAAQIRYKSSTALPSSLIVPSLSAIRDQINKPGSQPLSLPGPSFKEVIGEAAISNDILSEEHLEVIRAAKDATELIRKIKGGVWSITEVTEAHLRMAAIAQQVMGCYSSIFFDKARARAKKLDERMEAGENVGKLCGLPISIKAHIGYQGTGSDRGFIFDVLDQGSVSRLLDEEEKTGAKCVPQSTLRLLRKQGDHLQTLDAVHVTALLDEGAIIIAKTVMPQSVMQLDTRSNLHGQTLNPWNLHLSPGGSSGGEAASVSSGATMLGIGTDIGGSVRQPAAVTGLYGLRCTIGRIAINNTRSTMLGNEGIIGTAGPLCRSKRDLDLVTEILVDGTAASDPFLSPPLPWKKNTSNERKKLRVGVLHDDGVVRPITPIRRAMKHALEALAQVESLEVIPMRPDDYYARGWALARELYFMDQGELIRSLAKMTGEPLLPLTEYILSSPVKRHDASECWELQYAREAFKREYWKDVWVKNDLDVLLCPSAHLCAPRIGEIRYWNYTSFFNLMDLPGVAFPVKSCLVDSRLDEEFESREGTDARRSLSKLDEETSEEYERHREMFNGAPVGLQLIGKRFREEELLDALGLVDDIVNKGR
ncbi:hypothetical protein CBS101457_006355 [Exobasidium rhododendri]|nr:hypothetical protein CBS101457_006355 [Exobasidium rhododendri]